jgi:DNA-binding transcriptional ArsR family regulator
VSRARVPRPSASVCGVLDWEAIARCEAHPVRLAILERLLSPPPDDDPAWSSSTLAQALGVSLATTSHHVRVLRDRGLLVEVGRKQVRGAMQTFLGLSEAALDG